MEGKKPLSRSATGTGRILDPVADFEHAISLDAQQVHADFKWFQEQQKKDPLSYMFEDAQRERDRFRTAMDDWYSNVEEKYKVNITFDKKNTWEEVVKVVEEAKVSYDDPAGKWGSIRKAFRKLSMKVGKTAPLLDGWMGLLPSQSEYASVICGGIKLIIGAAASLDQIRDDIMDALEDIPQKIDRAERAVKAQKSDRLRELASDLYVAVIDVLWYILRWYNEKLPKRIFKPLLEQANYGSHLREKTSKVSKLVESIKDEVQIGIGEGVEELKQRFDYQWVRYENPRYGHALSGATPHVFGHARGVLESDPRAQKRLQAHPQIAATDITKDDLLSLLEIQTEIPSEDNQSSLDQDRVAWFMRSNRLREWLTCAKSQTLFVNGNCDNLDTSPLAANCTRLLKSLEPVASVHVVHYFCKTTAQGYHGSFLPIAAQIFHAFIGQLLAKFDKLNLSFMKGTDLSSWARDPKSLRKSFRKLVDQLPRSVGLFCILDVAALNKEPALEDEMCVAIHQLLKTQQNTETILKILITSPAMGPFTKILEKEKIAIDEIVQIPEHLDEKRQRFDALRWDLNAGQILEDLLLQITDKRRKRSN